MQKETYIPSVTSPLRNSIIEMPKVIRNASGINIYGKRIKSIVYSLDVSLIANTDADAILCVYPFTPNTQILNAVSLVAKSPILVGVGGGLTSGERSARLASHAEENNASGIVLNGPVDIPTTKKVREYVDIPVIYTVIDKSRPLQPYIDAGVNIFNVSGGKNTIELVKWVREQYPTFPIIASGGKTTESIQATIDAGANAITYTAYGMMEEYFHKKMDAYRNKAMEEYQQDIHNFIYSLTDTEIKLLRQVFYDVYNIGISFDNETARQEIFDEIIATIMDNTEFEINTPDESFYAIFSANPEVGFSYQK